VSKSYHTLQNTIITLTVDHQDKANLFTNHQIFKCVVIIKITTGICIKPSVPYIYIIYNYVCF